MFSPGQQAAKSQMNTAAMVAGNPWFALGGAALDALGGGPSNAVGAASSGGSPINMAPVNIGGGTASGQNKAGGTSAARAYNTPSPLNPQDFGAPVGVAGYGPPIPQPDLARPGNQAPAMPQQSQLPLLALAGGAAFLLFRNFV